MVLGNSKSLSIITVDEFHYPVLVLYTSSFFSVVAVRGRLDSNSDPTVWSTSAGASSGTGAGTP